jgi:methionine-gamma-lyase
MAIHPRTRAVHAGRDDLADLGVHALPLDLSSTYPLRDLTAAEQSMDAMGRGGRPHAGEPIYARMHNPTVDRFEQALAAMEEMGEAVAFASGMAAVTAALMAARERGERIVAVRPLYGGTDHLLASGMLGFTTKWVEAKDIATAITPDTALVIVETPSNPTLDLVDLDEVVRQAQGVPVMVDNTFATPILQQPARHGVALVLHSATKFLGGHGDVVGGVIATDAKWAAALRRVRVATGALLHPLAAYLLHRGLPTLPLRVEAAQRTASELATRLCAHPYVTAVKHPSLPGADPRGLIGRQMAGPGSILSFDVIGGHEAARAVLAGLEWITPAVSLGSTDTLLQHPAGLTHHVVDEKARAACGIGPGTLRLSVGLEDVEDLWIDLDTAVRRAHEAAVNAMLGETAPHHVP